MPINILQNKNLASALVVVFYVCKKLKKRKKIQAFPCAHLFYSLYDDCKLKRKHKNGFFFVLTHNLWFPHNNVFFISILCLVLLILKCIRRMHFTIENLLMEFSQFFSIKAQNDDAKNFKKFIQVWLIISSFLHDEVDKYIKKSW